MIQGVLSLVSGMRMLLVHAELRAVLWRMLALLLVLMLLFSAGVYYLVDYLAGLWLPDGDAWYQVLLSWLVWLLALLLALASGIVVYVTLATSVAAPWLDLLAERVECMAGRVLEPPHQSAASLIAQSAINSIRPLIGLALWGLAAVICLWLPPLATALWSWGSIRYLSYELIDVPASRRMWNFKQRKEQLLNRRWFYIGFSGAALLMLMVPVLNLLVIPAAVVGLSRYLHESGLVSASQGNK